MEAKGNVDQLEKLLSRQIDVISKVDWKITPILSLDMAMLAVLAAVTPSVSRWTVGLVAFGLLSSIFLAMSLVILFAASFPRAERASGKSAVYFGGILTRSETGVLEGRSRHDRRAIC